MFQLELLFSESLIGFQEDLKSQDNLEAWQQNLY